MNLLYCWIQVDRGGTFLGSLRVLGGARPVDLGMALLERGLAKLHPNFDPERDSNGVALVAAESAARDRKIKVRFHHIHISVWTQCFTLRLDVCTTNLRGEICIVTGFLVCSESSRYFVLLFCRNPRFHHFFQLGALLQKLQHF